MVSTFIGCFPVASLISSNRTVHSVDFGRVSCDELQNFEIPFSFRIDKTGTIESFRKAYVDILRICLLESDHLNCSILLISFLYCFYASLAIMHGFGCWFDVTFLGTTAVIELSTAPDKPTTHWYQVI